MEEKLELKVEKRSRRPPRARPGPDCPPLEVTVWPREQTVAQGSPASLQCSVTAPGPPQTFRYFWEKVREEISEERSQLLGSELRLRAVEVSDRGLYVCQVISPCGSRARSSSILEVERREPPSMRSGRPSSSWRPCYARPS